MRWGIGVTAALVVSVGASAAMANETPVYRAAPDWVKPAPPIDIAKLDGNSPVLLMMDQQHRFEGGRVTAYTDQAIRMASSQVLAQAGTVQLPWQPHHGELIIHRAQILRGGETIDLLAKGEPFSVLRREEQLEQLQVNGVLTATMTVEDLRVGDVLRLTTSVTTMDDALKGQAQTVAQLVSFPARTDFARVRVLWPKRTPLKWRVLSDGVAPKPVTLGAFEEIELLGALEKPPELPADAPARYHRLPLVEATTFADWDTVSRTMAPHYATTGLIAAGSPLAAEVAKIKARSNDPRTRAALALQFVQDEIRYLFNGMAGGNYVPQSPSQTWSLRYGDCKAKTLLLLAMLRDMDIEAEAVLASIQMGDFVPKRLPSAAAFDHVIVRADIGGQSLWLDGTGSGDRLADIGDTPPFRHVLPLREAGTGLMPVAMRAPERPLVDVDMQIDQSAGLSFPALYSVTMRVRGPMAEMANTAWSQADAEQRQQMTQQLVSAYAPESALVEQSLTHDPATSSVVITAKGLYSTPWVIENKRYRMLLDAAVSSVQFTPDRARAAWRDIPVATAMPEGMAIRRTIIVPAAGFTFEGDTSLPSQLAGQRLKRSATIDGRTITVEDSAFNTGAEIAPADVAATRATVAAAHRRMLKAVAPTAYPAQWQTVAAGRRDGRFDAHKAAYAKLIANDPDDAHGYRNRASFLSGIYDYRAALADLDKVIEFESSASALLQRSWLHSTLGDDRKALADAQAALEIEPDSQNAVRRIANLHSELEDEAVALALIEERVGMGGDEEANNLAAKSYILARHGKGDAAVEAMDAAVAVKPSDANLLNSRCWLKGTLDIALDTGLRDCTRSIELGENPAAALDSRALVYFRMGRMDDALTDLNAALDIAPNMGAALYLRGIIRSHRGDASGAKADLDAARMMSPRIAEDYDRWGVKPKV